MESIKIKLIILLLQDSMGNFFKKKKKLAK